MVRIGPGTLVAVCGPSGAGKDTLIARARALSAGERNVAFPLRVVTRATTGHEDHESMSEVEFDRAKDEGAFAFWWAAHGLKYGVPADVDGDLASGRCVVCNVSRTVLPALKERYARVLAVLVTAPPEVLAVRLGERGRASDGSIAERMARTAALAGTFSPDIVIENVGPPDRGAKVLIGAIASQFPVFSI
jgi:ribose 1,5-bisphosphokinase